MHYLHKYPVLFVRTPRHFCRRGIVVALAVVFLTLLLPLFSPTRADSAHPSARVSAGAGASTRVPARAGVSLRSLFAPATASAAPATTLNFQARLQTAGGAIVGDGHYNIQFKLYDTATGGTALWTETYSYNSGTGTCAGPLGTNDCRVRVVHGYVSVYLGSHTSFPSTIPWDQQLYLTMNVGGTATTGAYPAMGDGEMAPRLKLTGVPYAMQAKSAGQLQTSTGGNQVTIGTTGTPRAAASTWASTRIPSCSATSIMFRATTTGAWMAASSDTRYRLRSRLAALTTAMTTSGLSRRMNSRLITSSGELAVRL